MMFPVAVPRAIAHLSLGRPALSLVRHSAYNLVGGLIPFVTALVTVPLYIHLIGPARYGVLAIAWILLGYFGLFDLGLGRATSFRIAALADASPQDRADTFWAAVCVNLGMGVVGGGILWIAAGYFLAYVFKASKALRPEITAAVPILALSVPVATLTGVLTGGMQGRQKFLCTNIVSVISPTLFQAFPLIVTWFFGPNLVQILLAALFARLIGLVVLARFCHVELARGHPVRQKRDEVSLLLKYGGWITVGSLIAPFLSVIGRFAIEATAGAVAVAVYTIPFQLAKQVSILPASINTAFFPRLAAADAEDRKSLEHGAVFMIARLVSLPVLGAIFLSQAILLIWVGRKLGEQAAPIAQILFITFWFNTMALIPLTNLQAKGRPDLVVKFQAMQLPPYGVDLYIGLKRFGILCAALAFLFRKMMGYGALNWANERWYPGAGVLTLNFAILVAGAYLSSLWTIADWRWWASAVLLGTVMLAVGWRTLPARLKGQILKRAADLRVGEVA
jgi:O-antigen/teichoic acid export membrane protein